MLGSFIPLTPYSHNEEYGTDRPYQYSLIHATNTRLVNILYRHIFTHSIIISPPSLYHQSSHTLSSYLHKLYHHIFTHSIIISSHTLSSYHHTIYHQSSHYAVQTSYPPCHYSLTHSITSHTPYLLPHSIIPPSLSHTIIARSLSLSPPSFYHPSPSHYHRSLTLSLPSHTIIPLPHSITSLTLSLLSQALHLTPM